VNLCMEVERGVVVLTSQEKWDCMKAICEHWRNLLEQGETNLDFKQLQSDRGFMVYVTQAYLGMKPYLESFHLSLETWRGGHDSEGWKLPKQREQGETKLTETTTSDNVLDLKLGLLTHLIIGGDYNHDAPSSGFTQAAPQFKQDLKALLHLAEGDLPRMRCVRSTSTFTAYYGFGDESSGGFGLTVARLDGLYGRFGIWGKDAKDQSSNYCELRNLVETVEEEAKEGYLKGGELWLFADNATAEGCSFRGGSSPKLLHELVLRLTKTELEYDFTLHVVHVAGTRMIAQGTDGLSRGIFLEGVMRGKDMLAFMDLSQTAVERYPGVLEFVMSWVSPILGESKVLEPEEWF
jgi:hypothetical protein